LDQLTKNVLKISLISTVFFAVGLSIYMLFRELNAQLAIYGLVILFVGLVIFAYLPEYVILKKLRSEETRDISQFFYTFCLIC
jgi:uncharacterized protein with PQ loop repeat